jgi:hypothetical protein
VSHIVSRQALVALVGLIGAAAYVTSNFGSAIADTASDGSQDASPPATDGGVADAPTPPPDSALANDASSLDGASTDAPTPPPPNEAGPDAATQGSGTWVKPNDLIAGRCATALCFNANGQRGWLGIEPLVELPIGKPFTFNSGGLADYLNSTNVSFSLSAGLRIWILQDWISLAVYLSTPLAPSNTTIQLSGSSFQYSASALRRPYPGLALGLLFDTLWIGLDRDELRNGADGSSNTNPAFPPNALVSGVWTWTIGIQPFTIARTSIATMVLSKPSQ